MVNEKRIRDKYRSLTELLIKRKLTITTMESATSGQIASLITDTEGSSAVLKGAFITYSNEAKIKQGVPSQVIEQYGVYSKETSNAMALAARQAYEADISIGVTGTMGNLDPSNNDSALGQVFFSIIVGGTIMDYHISLEAMEGRLAYKLAVAEVIYDELMKALGEG